MKVQDNPYYSPEKSGLSIFWQKDTAGSYEFNMFVVWEREEDNTLWYSHDSGCSCPTPFEDVHELTELTPDTWFNFQKVMEEGYQPVSEQDIIELKSIVKDHWRKNGKENSTLS